MIQESNLALISEIREFNRYYTRILGLLNQHIYSAYSLTEARILYEIGYNGVCTASRLIDDLGIDRGYLSRILKKFESAGLLRRQRLPQDARVYKLELTSQGKDLLDELDRQSSSQIQNLIQHLEPQEHRELFTAMNQIRSKLNPSAEFSIRDFVSEDIDFVISRHRTLYAIEHGFDATFGGYVAVAMHAFAASPNHQRDNLWIATHQGTRVGSIAIVNVDETTAQLRWFLVEPSMRRHGLGQVLINTALTFAREKGYREVFLWTVDKMQAARRLYQQFGFTLTESTEHELWGQQLTEEKWTLQLS